MQNAHERRHGHPRRVRQTDSYAMQHQEQSANALEKSIERLEDSLAGLGVAPEPNDSIQE